MIDWKKLAKDYPKSFEIFHGWFCKIRKINGDRIFISGLIFRYLPDFNIRDLYDFFDEYFHIVIDKIDDNNDFWTYKIYKKYCGNEKIKTFPVVKDTRQQAETAAFTKTFETMEKRLNDEKN